jgi:hypothetical protein
VQLLALEAKSVVRRLLRMPDPWKTFRDFERTIHPGTWDRQAELLSWLAEVAPDPGPRDRPDLAPDSANPVVRGFAAHWARLEREFRGKHAARAGDVRFLVHLPPFDVNPAGHSLFENLGRGLAFCGLPVEYWEPTEPLADRLAGFRPTFLVSIDHLWYGPAPAVGAEAVAAVREYRRRDRLGLVLSCNHFPTEPGVLGRRLDEARGLGAAGFFSFQAEPFVRTRYRPVTDRGFPVLSLEFGANPLTFFPVPGVERDLDYVYLASTNFEKWQRVAAFLTEVFRSYPGVILGPGWPRAAVAQLPDHHQRYLYARARVGVNLHVPFQIADPTELNERAYNLAACGTPQVMDNPALLPDRLGRDGVFSAATPDEYDRLFRFARENPSAAAERAVNAQAAVLGGHTVFHRADRLVAFLDDLPTTG